MRHSNRIRMVALWSVAAVAAVFVFHSCTRPRLTAHGTLDEFCDSLGRAGFDYETRWIRPGEIPGGEQGLYLKRPGDDRTWEELARAHSLAPLRAKGYVVVRRMGHKVSLALGSIQEGRVQIGEFVLEGDPDHLEKLAEAMRE
jgi:hypothetical protein